MYLFVVPKDDVELSTSSTSSLPEAGSIPSSSRDLLNKMVRHFF